MTGAVVALVLIGVVVAIIAGRSSVGSSGRSGDRLERDRSPRWARLRDVRDLVMIDERALSDRAVLGRLEGRLLAMPPLHSVLVLALGAMAAFWLYWLAAAFSMKAGRVPWSREFV